MWGMYSDFHLARWFWVAQVVQPGLGTSTKQPGHQVVLVSHSPGCFGHRISGFDVIVVFCHKFDIWGFRG